MKFSYEEPHVWYQFALSLIETGKVKTFTYTNKYITEGQINNFPIIINIARRMMQIVNFNLSRWC